MNEQISKKLEEAQKRFDRLNQEMNVLRKQKEQLNANLRVRAEESLKVQGEYKALKELQSEAEKPADKDEKAEEKPKK